VKEEGLTEPRTIAEASSRPKPPLSEKETKGLFFAFWLKLISAIFGGLGVAERNWWVALGSLLFATLILFVEWRERARLLDEPRTPSQLVKRGWGWFCMLGGVLAPNEVFRDWMSKLGEPAWLNGERKGFPLVQRAAKEELEWRGAESGHHDHTRGKRRNRRLSFRE